MAWFDIGVISNNTCTADFLTGTKVAIIGYEEMKKSGS